MYNLHLYNDLHSCHVDGARQSMAEIPCRHFTKREVAFTTSPVWHLLRVWRVHRSTLNFCTVFECVRSILHFRKGYFIVWTRFLHLCTQNIKCLVQKYAIWNIAQVSWGLDMPSCSGKHHWCHVCSLTVHCSPKILTWHTQTCVHMLTGSLVPAVDIRLALQLILQIGKLSLVTPGAAA